ncbi:MAG: histidine kinase [Cyclobacteriaceae bacterium]
MWPGIFMKLIFILILWKWIIPLFKKKSMLFVFLLLGVVLLLFIYLEVLISWQFERFSLQHMAHHSSWLTWVNPLMYLVITLIALIIHFVRESFRNEQQKRKLIESQLTTELEFLHAQINPHFLFNTLNNLFSIAQRDKNEELATSISMLSGLMRYMLYDSKVTRVSLQSEIAHLRDFIGLAQMRFTSDELQVDVEVSGNVAQEMIAPMVILPFVENAFKHGIRIEEVSKIDIGIKAGKGQIEFKCSNYDNATQEPAGSSGIGLENVRRRLALLYPDKHTLEIKKGEFFEINLTVQS